MLKINPSQLAHTIEALKNGDRTAFEKVYNSFGPKLYAFTKKLVRNKDDADEIVQEVFLKIWERKHFLDPEQNFDGYLFRIARNLVYNKAKHQVYEVAYSKYLIGNTSVAENPTEESMYYKDLDQMVEQAYTSLPPVRKQVFVMSRIEGLSNSEIAEKLHTSNSNIENHINKALRDIRLKLKGYKLIHFIILTFFSYFQ